MKKNLTNPKKSLSKFLSLKIKMLVLLGVVCWGVMGGGGSVSAADYYVKTDGDNTKDGLSLETAWATIQHAADTMEAGNAVYVQSGTYNEEVVIRTSGTVSGRISFIGDGLPFVNSVSCGFDIYAEYITVTGFKVTASNGHAFRVGDRSYPPPPNPIGHITISYNTIECPDGGGILFGYVNDAIIEWNDINVHEDGISWKTGYTFGQDVKNNIISHNNISVESGYGCLYIGRYTENITVTYNYIDRAGWNALNVGESKNSYIGYNELNGANIHHQCIDARNKDSIFEGNHIYNNPGISDSHMFYLVGGSTEDSRVRNMLVKDLLIENSCPYSHAFHIEDYQDVTLENVTIEDTPGVTGALIVNSVQMAVSENFNLIDSDIQMEIDFRDSNKAKIINTKFSTLDPVNSDVTIYYYLDVLVQDQNGNPVSGANVTVIHPNVTVDYYNTEVNVTPINLHTKEIVTPVKTAGILIPQQITVAYTEADGHTPLPYDANNTLVIADYRRDHHGTPWYSYPKITTDFNNYTIIVERDGVSANVSGINPDKTWHREDPNTYQNTITIILDTEEGDTAPPYTSDHNPAKDAASITKDTNIIAHLKDDGDGVDQFSIVMTVEGEIVTPVITGTAADYTLTYDPPTDFSYNQIIDITIDAQDLASTPNVMTQDSYSFTIESDPSIPTITLQKQVDKTEASEGETITYTLTYTNTGEAQATNIVITDDIPIKTTYIDNSATGSYTYDSDNKILTWTIDTLEPGASGNVSFQVTINEEGIGLLDRKHLALASVVMVGVCYLRKKRLKESVKI